MRMAVKITKLDKSQRHPATTEEPGTGLVESMIHKLKRLSILNVDSTWKYEKIAEKLAQIIENIKLVPNAADASKHSQHTSGEH